MGSGNWLETIISRKKSKQRKSKQISDQSGSSGSTDGATADPETIREFAAVRIQSAYRRFKARKTLRCLRGVRRLTAVSQAIPVKKQASATLGHIQSWNRIQAAVRARRAFMVSEGQNRQKKLESRLKLEAKFHDLEVEWSGGTESLEETIARIQQREEAAVKRERAMAYAFSHQWRARSVTNQGTFIYELGKGGWGWSWMDRWISARPWESRCLVYPENSTAKKPLPKVLSRTAAEAPSPTAKNGGLSSPATEPATNAREFSRRASMPMESKKASQEGKLRQNASSKLKPKNSMLNQEKLQHPQTAKA